MMLLALTNIGSMIEVYERRDVFSIGVHPGVLPMSSRIFPRGSSFCFVEGADIPRVLEIITCY